MCSFRWPTRSVTVYRTYLRAIKIMNYRLYTRFTKSVTADGATRAFGGGRCSRSGPAGAFYYYIYMQVHRPALSEAVYLLRETCHHLRHAHAPSTVHVRTSRPIRRPLSLSLSPTCVHASLLSERKERPVPPPTSSSSSIQDPSASRTSPTAALTAYMPSTAARRAPRPRGGRGRVRWGPPPTATGRATRVAPKGSSAPPAAPPTTTPATRATRAPIARVKAAAGGGGRGGPPWLAAAAPRAGGREPGARARRVRGEDAAAPRAARRYGHRPGGEAAHRVAVDGGEEAHERRRGRAAVERLERYVGELLEAADRPPLALPCRRCWRAAAGVPLPARRQRWRRNLPPPTSRRRRTAAGAPAALTATPSPPSADPADDERQSSVSSSSSSSPSA